MVFSSYEFILIFLPIVLASIGINYLFALFIQRQPEKIKLRTALLALGVLFNVGLIGYYRYFDFFLGSTMWPVQSLCCAGSCCLWASVSLHSSSYPF